MAGDDELQRKLRVLRQSYVDDGPRRMAELWSAFARVQNGDVAAIADLGERLHRLAGTGGAYGLARVTEYARGAEAQCQAIRSAGRAANAAECESLRGAIQNLATAFAEASTGE
jgi:hypothetical protein